MQKFIKNCSTPAEVLLSPASMSSVEIAGQLNFAERRILQDAILCGEKKREVVLEVGTWLGGGSTLHLLRALEQNGTGHLWGIEADRSIYEQMLENIRAAAPEALHRFTPLFGLSHEVIPRWLEELGPDGSVDVAFLDGGDNPMEQITEFQLLDPRVPIGGRLLAHDAKLRKGKWLRPYWSLLDHWRVELHDVSDEGLLSGVKIAAYPSPTSARAAARQLRKLRREPVELIGRLLPSKACDVVISLLPRSIRLRVHARPLSSAPFPPARARRARFGAARVADASKAAKS